MSHKILGLFLTLSLTLASVPSYAWLHLEPLIGYNKGQEQSTTAQGIGLGVKVGIDYHNFFIVEDIDYSDLQQGTQSSVKYTNTGLSFGGDFQRVRVWYGMIMSAQQSYPSGTATSTSKGTGTKFGIGTDLGSKLNLNLELRSINYTSNDPGTGVSAAITEVGTFGFLSLSWIL